MRHLLLLFSFVPALSQAAPLGFSAALDLAERQSPALAAQRARLAAVQAVAERADALPDPKLFIGIDNLPATGPDRWKSGSDFMTMRKIGVMQEVPNSLKREARADAAAAAVDFSQAERRVERAQVRSETAQAWITRYYLEQRLALFSAWEIDNHLLAEAAHARLGAGRGDATDALSAREEEARFADRRDEQERDLARARAELRRLIGAQGDEPLVGTPPSPAIDRVAYLQRVLHHPELESFEPAERKAAAELREAEATRRPDWGVEVAYQQRARQFGDMVSVQFSFDLPLFQATRQEPDIAARREETLRLAAERENALRMHAAELRKDLADLDALEHQLERARDTWLPLAQQKLELQNAAYRAGRGELSVLLAARREVIAQKLRLIDLEQQQSLLAAKLHYSYGENAQ